MINLDSKGTVGRIYEGDYIQNIEALGLVVSENKFFMFLPL